MARPPSIRLSISRIMQAEVIRIEQEQEKDPTRRLSPDEALVLERLAKAEAALDKRTPQKDEDEGPKRDPAEALARLKKSTSPAAESRGADGDDD
jgi:hypothetical protein